MVDVSDQSAHTERAEGSVTAQNRRQQQKKQARTLVLTLALLSAGLALLWVTKTVVGIEGDAIFIALLLVPILVFLAMSEQLESLSIFGASAKFVQKVADDVTVAVAEVGQREEGRVAYRGKLDQVLEEEDRKFALIYADVDGLRRRMRTIYLKERETYLKARKEHSDLGRKREGQIRLEMLDHLEFALTDAFYDSDLGSAKMDVFRLAEPDIAVIVRCHEPHKAQQVADLARKLFVDETGGATATTAVIPATHLDGDLTPKRMDDAATAALKRAKDARENEP